MKNMKNKNKKKDQHHTPMADNDELTVRESVHRHLIQNLFHQNLQAIVLVEVAARLIIHGHNDINFFFFFALGI